MNTLTAPIIELSPLLTVLVLMALGIVGVYSIHRFLQFSYRMPVLLGAYLSRYTWFPGKNTDKLTGHDSSDRTD